jgi:hypothetical protein
VGACSFKFDARHFFDCAIVNIGANLAPMSFSSRRRLIHLKGEALSPAQ